MTKTELTALQRERFFYVLGMASGMGATMPEKVFPILASITKAFKMEFEQITEEHVQIIMPWFEDFLVILRSLSAKEIIDYAKKASKMTMDRAGGMMFG